MDEKKKRRKEGWMKRRKDGKKEGKKDEGWAEGKEGRHSVNGKL